MSGYLVGVKAPQMDNLGLQVQRVFSAFTERFGFNQFVDCSCINKIYIKDHFRDTFL